MGNKKVWIILLAVVVVVAGVLIGVIASDKNVQAKLAADLQQQVDAVAKERDAIKTELEKVKTDAENALAAAKSEADTLLAAAKGEAEKLVAEKDALIEKVKEDAEKVTQAAKDEADKLVAEKDALIEKVKADAENLTAAAKADAEKLIAEKDALIEKVKQDAEIAAKAARDEADKLIAEKDELVAKVQADAEAAVKAARDEVTKIGAEKDEAVNQVRIEVETAAKANAQKALDEIQARLDEAVKAKETAELALEALKQEAEKPAALVTSDPVVIVEPTPAPVGETVDNSGVAYILFADASQTNQYALEPLEGVEAVTAKINGEGDYQVALKFTAPVEGISLMALTVKNGEEMFPGYVFTVTDIKLNGQSIALTGKPYTASDDGIDTLSNLYNPLVAEIPADARCAEGGVSDCVPSVVSPEAFTGVTEIEVSFTVTKNRVSTAFLMFVDGVWNYQHWNDGAQSAVISYHADVDKPGSYEVSLVFPEDAPAKGVSLLTLSLTEGNIIHPKYVYEINEVLINGEPIAVGKGYTSSEDQIESRVNIMNEWVNALPADARTRDGNLEGCSSVIVDKTLFTDVKSIAVRFTAF